MLIGTSGLDGYTGYLAPDGFLAELEKELGETTNTVYGNLVLTKEPARPVAWAANTWYNPTYIPITSISDAAKKLRALQRNWAFYPFASHRRAALITEQLPKVSAKPMVFGTKAPQAPLGSWILIDANMLIASTQCSSPFMNGEAHFIEDRVASPSRAYLKLWELFTILNAHPKPGDFCIDLGSSPGGWTWVLQQLGARILSIDKAPLDDRIAILPGIEYQCGSAFALDPSTVSSVDWLFSDVVCYPKRLLTLVHKWLAAGNVRRFVCTLKFQGETDFETMQGFAAIPGSRLLHLHHNKHELTWIKI